MYIGFGIDAVSFLVIACAAALIYSGILALKYFIRGRFSFSLTNFILEILIITSLIAVILLTLSPIRGLMLEPVYMSVNLVPFENILEMFRFSTRETILRMVGGNIVLFMPLTFFMTLRFLGKLSVIWVVFIGIGLSTTIELIQLFHPLRQTNIDDVMLNSLGVFFGVISGLIISKIFGIRSE
ncbi:VanZ family protein [Natranaerofaba carboxydovora]|uniref:VanZ family protein n=1 Tax=Natranaerofaba carboxydovora TaxID=2742683 RepID=UPI001F132DE7|nr:VanZ family protein [Natranaerofaba carboxydovora]UMZ74211.1 VanZ like family protein [Natranaerofaba carboxydovora]